MICLRFRAVWCSSCEVDPSVIYTPPTEAAHNALLFPQKRKWNLTCEGLQMFSSKYFIMKLIRYSTNVQPYNVRKEKIALLKANDSDTYEEVLIMFGLMSNSMLLTVLYILYFR